MNAKGKVRLGLMLPNRSPAMGYGSAAEMVSLAEVADQSNAVDHLWVGDSLLAKPRLEALSLLGALAVRTRHVRLGTAALASLPLRHPILLALQWITLDLLSQGRMILGASIGGAPRTMGSFASEYDAFGVASSSRAQRAEEAITLLRLLWSGSKVDFQGEYWRFESVDIGITPYQDNPPIWLVSSPFESGKEHLVQRGLRRVAQYADGWMASRLTPEQFKRGSFMIDSFVVEFEREQSPLDKCFCGHLLSADTKATARVAATEWLNAYYMNSLPADTVDLWTGMGTPEECAEWIQSYILAGAEHVLLRFASYDWSAQLDIFLEQVVPLLELKLDSKQ